MNADSSDRRQVGSSMTVHNYGKPRRTASEVFIHKFLPVWSSGYLNFLGLNCTFCVTFYVNREPISTFPSKSFIPFPFLNGSWLVHGVTKQKISTLLRRACVLSLYSKVPAQVKNRVFFNSPKDFRRVLSFNLTFRGPCIVIYSYNKTNEMH